MPTNSALARIIAFYLPQYFPIPENDAWWGPGFTEWINVAKARPLYRGHWQPRLPADLGFYDLRVPETRAAQARLARESGVEGFCYWYYWFGGGRRILERPFEEVLSSGEPDFPFCLAWANQSWRGIWHGAPNTILLEQTYPGPEDEAAHFRWCLRAFNDPRYLRVDGKPIFVVFAPHDMPSTASYVAHWRSLAEQAGLPGLYLVAITNIFAPGIDRYHDPIYEPFDALTPLTPQDYLETVGRTVRERVSNRLKSINAGGPLNRIRSKLLKPTRVDYADVVKHALEDMPDSARYLPCVLPNWDNTPRSGYRGVVYENATPERFGEYMRKAIARVAGRRRSESIIFLKAWNEWAEGNYVEPDARYGHAFLDVLRESVLAGAADSSDDRESGSRARAA